MIEEIISKIINKNIIHVEFQVHEFDGVKNTQNPQSIKIEFGNKLNIFLRCGSDGETLLVSDIFEEFYQRDMGEFGRENIEDFTNIYPWSKSLNKFISDIKVFKSNKKQIGISFSFKEIEIFIINNGDSIFIYDKYPFDITIFEEIITDTYRS